MSSRRKRQGTEGRGVAAVNVDFELAIQGLIVTYADLGGIQPKFVVEWQRRNRCEYLRSVSKIDVAIDPTGVHDIDRQGRLSAAPTAARFEQQAHTIAAQFELVARTP